jgi:UPF0755 protein
MRGLKWLVVLTLLGALTAAGLGTWWAFSPLSLPADKVEVTIRAGTARGAAMALRQGGVQVEPIVFALLARATGQDKRIKAGYYEFQRGMSPLDILGKLARGETTNAEILFVEGWTFRQMRTALRSHPAVAASTVSDAELMKAIGASEPSPEGLFFPNTYWFAKGTPEADVLKLAYRKQKKLLADLWAQRASDLPFASPYEALILASIVEKETGQRADRPRIAGVFVNRLKKGMLLQTDPSVVYGLGERFDGNLRKRDLLADGPYNTYTRPGLPPTPIAMPGLESLTAVLNPERHDFLYFVSRGDGTSEFSTNLNDHNRAVNKYQRGLAS